MLLKFAYQDFLDDRRFKNTTKVNIRNYETLLSEFEKNQDFSPLSYFNYLENKLLCIFGAYIMGKRSHSY